MPNIPEGVTSTPGRRCAHTLETALKSMSEAGTPPDVITFAGNGEPTITPISRG